MNYPLFRGAYMTPEQLEELWWGKPGAIVEVRSPEPFVWMSPTVFVEADPEAEARGIEDDLGAFRRAEEMTMAQNAMEHHLAVAKLRQQWEELQALARSIRRDRLLLCTPI